MSGVEIRVRSNSTQARQDLGKLQKSVGNIEQSTKRLQSAFNKIAIGGAAFLSLASFTKGITRASDSITNMENKIALVTGRGKELNSTMQSLARVSSQTRVSFSTTAETFNRFGLALQGSGTSAKELLNVTRTINQAVTISGASSESARAAIVQFGQGLASGQLRGQELNSVLEQTPRIARAIADGIGIPFGQLRDAAADGKLTTEAVLKAIQKAAPEIAQEFTLIEKTVDSVSNALRFQLLGALNVIARSTGWSNAVITGIENLTKGLKYFTDNAEITFMLYKLRAAVFISDIKKTFEPLTNIFTVKFDPVAAAKNLRTNFNTFLDKAKDIITFEGFYDENTKQFDFSAFFGQFTLPPKFEENFTKVSTTLSNFVENIKELYSALFDKKPTQSQSLLVPISLNTKEIENEEGILDKFLNNLTKFSGSVIGLILSLKDSVTPLFESIGEAINNVSSSIAATVEGLGGYESILKRSTTAFKSYYDEITKILDLDTKAASSKDFIKGLIPEANTDLSRQINNQIKKIEESIFGKEVFIESGVSVKTPGILQNSFDFLDENKGLLAAAATGVGLAIVFPETTAAALQLAAIGAGLALVSVVQSAFSRGLPVLLTFGSYQAFMKGVADDPERQKEIEEISKGIVDSLQEAFLGLDQEGSSKIVDNIGAFLSSVGKGIISGLFEGTEFNNNFINAFAGALAIAAPLFIFSGRGLGAMAGIGLHLLRGMFTKNSVASALLEGLTLGVISSNSSKVAEQGKKFGKMFLRGLGAAFTLDFIFSGADEFIKEGQIKLGLDETEADSILSQIIRKTSIGFAKGAGIAFTSGIKNPYAVIGAGIAGSIYELFTTSEIRAAFQDLGREIYAGFRGAIFGEEYTGGDPKAVADSVKAQDATKNTIQLKQGELGDAEKQLTRYQNLFETAEQRLQRLVDVENELKQNPIGNEGLLAANRVQQENVRAEILRNGMLVSNTAADIKRLSDAIATLQSTIKPENLDISLPPQMDKRNPFFGLFQDYYKSSGGMITGAGGPKDDKIPHMLSNGEYVIQASAVKKFGPSFMDALNKGQVPQFKSNGGSVGNNLENADLSVYQTDLKLKELFNNYLHSELDWFEGKEKGFDKKDIENRLINYKDYFNYIYKNKIPPHPNITPNDNPVSYKASIPEISHYMSAYIVATTELKRLKTLVESHSDLNGNIVKDTNESNFSKVLEEHSKNNPLGNYGNADRRIKTEPLSFKTKELINPFDKEFQLDAISVDTNNLSLSEDIKPLNSYYNKIYRTLEKPSWEEVLDLNFAQMFDLLGYHAFNSLQEPGINYQFDLIRDSIANSSFNWSREKPRTYADLGFNSFEESIASVAKSTPKELIDHANEAISSLEKQATNFGYNFKVNRDAFIAGENAEFGVTWDASGLNTFNPEMFLNLMSFKTEDPIHFLTSYFAALHEVGHGLDFLRDSQGISKLFQNDQWPAKGASNQAGALLANEADANIFARNFALPNIDHDVLEGLIQFSQGSYLESYLEDAIKENKNFLKENPRVLSVLDKDYNFDLKNIKEMGSEYNKDSLMSQFMKTNLMPSEIYSVNSIREAKRIWEDLKTTILNSLPLDSHKDDFKLEQKKFKEKLVENPLLPRYATGGYVTGEGGPTDDKIPAMLSNKEFVVNAKQTSKFRPILEAINSGMVSGFASGMDTNFGGRANIGGVVTNQANTVDAPLQSVKATKAVQKAIDEIDKQLASFNITLLEAELQLKTSTDQKVLELAQDLKMKILHDKIIPLTAERNNLLNQETIITQKSNEVKAKANSLSARELASGANFAEGIKQDFAVGFREALNTGDFMEIDLIDSFTTNWLNSFSQGFTDSLFGTMEKDTDGKYTSTGIMGQLQQLGGGASKFGGKASPMAKEGEELTSPLFGEGGLFGGMINSIKTGISKITSGTGEGGSLSNLISSIGPFFSGLSENLSSSISSLLGGMGGSGGASGGGWMSLISTGLSLFGFNNGGIVPSTPYSKAGMDSVPAMLTPGELVVPANKVKSYQDNTNKQQNIVNLSISGDVSRQTRQEIIKMLPTISAGVNATNKENNYKGR